MTRPIFDQQTLREMSALRAQPHPRRGERRITLTDAEVNDWLLDDRQLAALVRERYHHARTETDA